MRQFQHIELTRSDALALRELVRPFDSTLPDFAKPVLEKLALKIYAVLIELEKFGEDKEAALNVPLDQNDCLLLNQKVGNEDWEGALPLLRQTWAIIFEWKHDSPPGTYFAVDEILGYAEQHEKDNGAASAIS